MKNKFSWKEDIMITTWLIFEMAGTIAFAFSGAAVGLYKRMDIFGITVLSVMTAVGGGMIRDVLCGITPPSVLRSPEGLIVSIVTALVVGFGYPLFRIPKRGKWVITILYHLSDTIGLAAFTVTGALTAFYRYPGYNIVLPVMLGLITAVGGGIIRDMMARRMPVVLYMDVYAIASIAGGLLLCALRSHWARRSPPGFPLPSSCSSVFLPFITTGSSIIRTAVSAGSRGTELFLYKNFS